MKLLTYFVLALTPLTLVREAQFPANTGESHVSTQETATGSALEQGPQADDPIEPVSSPPSETKPALIDAPEAPELAGAPVAQDELAARHQQRRIRRPGRTYAPIGIPLTQQVVTGQAGFTIRASYDRFEGLRDSRANLSSTGAFASGYSIAPTNRDEQRYELEAMFGFNRRLDLYMVVPYSAHGMDQDLSLGGQSTVESSGLGDVQFGGVFRSYDSGPTRVSFVAGLSIPTGKIDANDTYAGAANTTLPYALQLGSGTFDLLPGVLIESRVNGVRVGARAAGRVHLQGANDEGWFRSNSMRLDLWAGKQISEDLRGSLRAQADWWGDYHGANLDLDPIRNPLEDSLRQGGSRVTLYGGLSKELDAEGNNRLELEIGFPVEEWLDGPALSQDWTAIIGWRVRF